MKAGHAYTFELKWKANAAANGKSIYAGAGPSAGRFSPTSLLAEYVRASSPPPLARSTQQFSLADSDGSTWQDTGLTLPMTSPPEATLLLGANVDLFTGTAGVNQDIGIFASDNGGADTLLAWKESGGFGGTFSPNAAFVQVGYQVHAGHQYVFKLKWKANRAAPGASIYAGAGPANPHSPTLLTAEYTNAS